MGWHVRRAGSQKGDYLVHVDILEVTKGCATWDEARAVLRNDPRTKKLLKKSEWDRLKAEHFSSARDVKGDYYFLVWEMEVGWGGRLGHVRSAVLASCVSICT